MAIRHSFDSFSLIATITKKSFLGKHCLTSAPTFGTAFQNLQILSTAILWTAQTAVVRSTSHNSFSMSLRITKTIWIKASLDDAKDGKSIMIRPAASSSCNFLNADAKAGTNSSCHNKQHCFHTLFPLKFIPNSQSLLKRGQSKKLLSSYASCVWKAAFHASRSCFRTGCHHLITAVVAPSSLLSTSYDPARKTDGQVYSYHPPHAPALHKSRNPAPMLKLSPSKNHSAQ